MEGVEINDIEYADEKEANDEEWNLSMITRGFKVKFTKDWEKWIVDWSCEDNFVSWGMWATYWQEYKDE